MFTSVVQGNQLIYEGKIEVINWPSRHKLVNRKRSVFQMFCSITNQWAPGSHLAVIFGNISSSLSDSIFCFYLETLFQLCL